MNRLTKKKHFMSYCQLISLNFSTYGFLVSSSLLQKYFPLNQEVFFSNNTNMFDLIIIFSKMSESDSRIQMRLLTNCAFHFRINPTFSVLKRDWVLISDADISAKLSLCRLCIIIFPRSTEGSSPPGFIMWAYVQGLQ